MTSPWPSRGKGWESGQSCGLCVNRAPLLLSAGCTCSLLILLEGMYAILKNGHILHRDQIRLEHALKLTQRACETQVTGCYSQSFRLSQSGEGSRIRISEKPTGDGCGCWPRGYTLRTTALGYSPYLTDGGLWGSKSSVICQKSRNGVKARPNSFHHRHRHHRHHLYYHTQLLQPSMCEGLCKARIHLTSFIPHHKSIQELHFYPH